MVLIEDEAATLSTASIYRISESLQEGLKEQRRSTNPSRPFAKGYREELLLPPRAMMSYPDGSSSCREMLSDMPINLKRLSIISPLPALPI